MAALVAHDRHGIHRLPALHLPHRHAAPARHVVRAAWPVREARAATALVAIATGAFGALWICAAAGLADTGWWHELVFATVVGFTAVCVATILGLRR